MIGKTGTLALCASLAFASLAHAEGDSRERVPVRVVVVTAFEIGNDTGDTPGEFQNWVDNLPLPDVVPFPQGYHPLRYNPEKHVLGIVAGEGPARMASSITALANDPRFDVTHAYWLLAGIAGVNPNVASVGSAVWAPQVVDGDLGYEIDAREIPSDWTTGYVPFGRVSPFQPPTPPVATDSGTNAFTMNAGLVEWAYQLSSGSVQLADDANLQQLRARYTDSPNAQRPPAITKGAVLAAGTFWIGALLNTWAENWVNYWTSGQGVFTTTAEEEAAYMQALTFLSQVQAVDLKRVMVLRGASDYSVPPPGQTAAQLLASEVDATGYSGFVESLNSTYAAGSAVVNELSGNWRRYRDNVPSAQP
jgi:purine nucleoside permease